MAYPKKKMIVFGMLFAVLTVGVGLYVKSINNDKYVTQAAPQLPNPPLKELAERKNISVGSFASLKYLR